MNDDRKRILTMLATGRITAEEAESLLDALASPAAEKPAAGSARHGEPKYLRIQMEKDREDEREPKHVHIRVPLQLLRSGVRLQGLMPPKARARLSAALAEKGMDFDIYKLKADSLESFIDTLTEASIDIESHDGSSRLKVSCE